VVFRPVWPAVLTRQPAIFVLQKYLPGGGLLFQKKRVTFVTPFNDKTFLPMYNDNVLVEDFKETLLLVNLANRSDAVQAFFKEYIDWLRLAMYKRKPLVCPDSPLASPPMVICTPTAFSLYVEIYPDGKSRVQPYILLKIGKQGKVVHRVDFYDNPLRRLFEMNHPFPSN